MGGTQSVASPESELTAWLTKTRGDAGGDTLSQRIQTFEALTASMQANLAVVNKEDFRAIAHELWPVMFAFFSMVQLHQPGGDRTRDDFISQRIPLYLQLKRVLEDLSMCVHTFDVLVQSNFTDATALTSVVSVAVTFELIHADVIYVDTLQPYEWRVIHLLNHHLMKWSKLTDLPYVIGGKSKMALRVVKHVFDRAQEEHTIVSQKVSEALVREFHRKQYWFDGDRPCTAYIIVSSHGTIEGHMTGDTFYALEATVPIGMALTRVSIVPPGSVAYASPQSTTQRVDLIKSVVTNSITKPYDPFKMLMKLSDELMRLQYRTEWERPIHMDDLIFMHNSLRPEAVMHVGLETYLNKTYTRSDEETMLGQHQIYLLNGGGADLMPLSNMTRLSDILQWCGTSGYNHVCMFDLSCNSFQTATNDLTLATILDASRSLTAQYKLGGGVTTKKKLCA